MPNPHAQTLTDWQKEGRRLVFIECKACSRFGRYSIRGLLEKWGDISMPDVMHRLTDSCEHKNLKVPFSPCKAKFVEG